MQTGIVADNYKTVKFEEELKKAGFTDYTITPFTRESMTIAVTHEESRLLELKKVMGIVQLYFTRSN